jgi:hypothetical protein
MSRAIAVHIQIRSLPKELVLLATVALLLGSIAGCSPGDTQSGSAALHVTVSLTACPADCVEVRAPGVLVTAKAGDLTLVSATTDDAGIANLLLPRGFDGQFQVVAESPILSRTLEATANTLNDPDHSADLALVDPTPLRR